MQELIKELLGADFRKIIISNPLKKDQRYRKVTFVHKKIRGQELVQIERSTEKQVFHENVEMERLADIIAEEMQQFRQLNCFGAEKETEIKLSKKGKVLKTVRSVKHDVTVFMNNDRKKKYLLEEGKVIEPLVDLGVFTKDGKVVSSMYDKYKQINRFIELIDDVLKEDGSKEITILDFGCGKSYLTFILYYYLVNVRGMKPHIIGLDLKADVIRHCNEIAEKYGYDGLSFEVGDISNYRYTDKVDMVITLHACDTATDYALYNAVRWHARYILSVPCCQHEINSQITSDSLVVRYGLIKERMSALFTDAIRANLLNIAGYRTQVIEFIDFEHSPKNILLRCVKGHIGDEKREKLKKEVEDLVNEYHLDPTLLKLLKEGGYY